MRASSSRLSILVAGLAVVGCSGSSPSSSPENPSSSGGALAVGGSTSAGGTQPTGGASQTNGTLGVGGTATSSESKSTASGGTTSSGGSNGTVAAGGSQIGGSKQTASGGSQTNAGGSTSGGSQVTGGTTAGTKAMGGTNAGGTIGGSSSGTTGGSLSAGGTGVGGMTTGGATTGGATTGGAATGGAATGGAATGGAATGGTKSTALAATPPMGWNSWNKFAGNINESLIKSIADAMVSSGMRDVGYEYVNIDDAWQASARASNGELQADSTRFAGGMKALADYVHGKGLKLGIYSDRGTKTCAGYPGSYNHETQDAQTFAAWGIDYLKYDNCYVPAERDTAQGMKEDYTKMGDALKASGRPIVYSICAWWFADWMPSVGHLWRTTTDIKDEWAVDNHSVLSLLNKNGGDTSRYGNFSETVVESAAYGAPGLAQYAGPGHWNDPDMLEVGNGGMSDTEYRSHFSLWAIMASPLIAGNDLRSMSQATKDILLNTDVIAVNQDPLGKQGKPISSSTTLEVWSKQLSGNATYAVVLFNRTGSAANISVTWSSLGINSANATVRDLWSHTDLGSVATSYTANVPSHGVVMLKVAGT